MGPAPPRPGASAARRPAARCLRGPHDMGRTSAAVHVSGRMETPEGTDCQTGSIVEATSLDVISAGQLPDRRSRRGRALRLVRPDRRRCAGRPSPRLSVCVGPFGQDEPYDGAAWATTALSTNVAGWLPTSSTKAPAMWTECGKRRRRDVLGDGLEQGVDQLARFRPPHSASAARRATAPRFAARRRNRGARTSPRRHRPDGQPLGEDRRPGAGSAAGQSL